MEASLLEAQTRQHKEIYLPPLFILVEECAKVKHEREEDDLGEDENGKKSGNLVENFSHEPHHLIG